MQPIGCPETSVYNYHSALHCIKSQKSEDIIACYSTQHKKMQCLWNQIKKVNFNIILMLTVKAYGRTTGTALQRGEWSHHRYSATER
jgi:hypothetical protein